MTVVLDSFEAEKNRYENLNFLVNDGQSNNIQIDEKEKEKEVLQSNEPKKEINSNFIDYIKENKIILKNIEMEFQMKTNETNEILEYCKNEEVEFLGKNKVSWNSAYQRKKGNIWITIQKIIKSNLYLKFEYFIIFLTVLNIILGSFTYNSKDYYLNYSTEFLDNVVYSFFFVEICLKITANGILFGKNAYLKKFHDYINLFGIIGFFLRKSNYIKEKSIILFDFGFLLKALLPLRILQHNKKLRTLVISLKQSLDQILNVAKALLIVWFVFLLYIIKKLKLGQFSLYGVLFYFGKDLDIVESLQIFLLE